MLFTNGLVYTMEEAPAIMDFRIQDGKIASMGKDLKAIEGEEVMDCSGLRVYPGMVEAHCHLGLQGSAIGYEGNDVNEMSHNDPITPQMRGIDSINVLDESVQRAREAGVTTVASGPGSANVVGGTFTAWKTAGNLIDDMVIQEPVAMKAAFGENPKRIYKEKALMTRMGVAAALRTLLEQTREYRDKKLAAGDDLSRMPAWNAKLEAMIPVIEKKLPLKCHAHQHNDIATILRIAKEYDLNVTLDHCTDGERIVEHIAASKFPVILGPSLTHKTKFELANKSFATAKVFADHGILFSITTDSPVVSQEYLPLCAALAMKEGLSEEDALKAITINPAKILGLDDRIGSLAPGKDADFIVCTGSLLDTANRIERVYINGRQAA